MVRFGSAICLLVCLSQVSKVLGLTQRTPCPLKCEHGGRCLPSAAALLGRGSGPSSWSCLCPKLWVGSLCSQRHGLVVQPAVQQNASHEDEVQDPMSIRAILPGGLVDAGIVLRGDASGGGLPSVNEAGGFKQPSPSDGGSDGFKTPAEVANSDATKEAEAQKKQKEQEKEDEKTSTKTDAPKSAAASAGVSTNSANGLKEFVSSLSTTLSLILGCFFFFCVIRTQFPSVYEGEAHPTEVSKTWFGWVFQSWNLTLDEISREAGLDHAMFIEFLRMAMRLCLMLGLPLVFLLGPLHYFFGGDAAGDNKLSWFSMANVKEGSWLFWVHSGIVWFVVVSVMYTITSERRRFLPRRNEWLKNLPSPRSHTVLVEDLPEEYQTDAKVKDYFDDLVFARPVVRQACVIKDTTELVWHLSRLEKIEDSLKQIRNASNPNHTLSAQLKTQKYTAEQEVRRWRETIQKSDDDFRTPNAFVEFESRRDKAIALKIFSEEDNEEVIVSPPPDIPDILWQNLKLDSNLSFGRDLAGKALIFAMFLSFMPLVIYVQKYARLEGLSSSNPLYVLQEEYPSFVMMWNGLVGSVALSVLMGLIPTILTLVFDNFFKMSDSSITQQLLLQWYFIFLIIFVVLVTAIGNSLLQTVVKLMKHPDRVLSLLADTLPSSTHFYLNYMAVQWGADALALIRTAQLGKYVAFHPIFGPERAKEMAEPEDQGVYGMGARSARLCLLLVVPLVFCTLAPNIMILGIITFALARVVYSYLFMYAETLKGDTGGSFWLMQLKCLQLALIIYILLMAGVLYERKGWECGLISGCSILYWKFSYDKDNREFKMETLDFREIRDLEKNVSMFDGIVHGIQRRLPRDVSKWEYRQPELHENYKPPQLSGQRKDPRESKEIRAQRKGLCS